MKSVLHIFFIILFVCSIFAEMGNMANNHIAFRSAPSPIYLWKHDRKLIWYILAFIIGMIGVGTTF